MFPWVVVFVTYLATTTDGFSFSPAALNRRRHPSFGPTYNLNEDKNLCILSATNTNRNNSLRVTRREIVDASLYGILANLLFAAPMSASALSAASSVEDNSAEPISASQRASMQKAIAYRTISLPIPEFDVNVPVSIWYPMDSGASDVPSSTTLQPAEIKYNYRISLRRIGQLLARWDFIPEFISKSFVLDPSISTMSTVRVVDGKNIPISTTSSTGTNVVFLAHGFLGSRSDLAYIAEDLAAQGFVCVASEYPESLEASYPRLEGLDRVVINRGLIPYVQNVVSQPILSYSAIGHSLGCGTVLQMGDDSWNRILMGSGKAPELPSSRSQESASSSSAPSSNYKTPIVGGRLLFISSVNDGPVTSWGGGIKIPQGYTVLQESQLDAIAASNGSVVAPRGFDRVALVFDREDAPNHISYLSENVNDAMLSFLSPLLPVTKALNIPVLDFDKYASSRDSVPTGNVLKPLISNFLLAAQPPK
uniref:1-alkyl-2-acetylglycerophosphocholine esterase n=1 Tax=Pseudo-nitzschia australis TaxID=44445 RepID=A0A7S4AX54_9STRA|mmetsp:Transcript_17130/g.37468  ORF Transcript_17130/g.37468 Transcript_17130/m.37468 type:complete len:479 (-) Transcript_17130:75-1511(-)|eukprot:CAMPEP_0168186700 /NCGR_PEP_ID=MMETSP0139_2-20121125/14591_1 /TAXON_ID=44445 /ORGANISM="Pseudo-nitzschia australis, Strain 10249 10 AB" /LENGTH=478 /DNA_ID=CAMNT_0008108763 /DNA_START=112 /DNA_END=1548 /DNA_ORIENTATION=+